MADKRPWKELSIDITYLPCPNDNHNVIDNEKDNDNDNVNDHKNEDENENVSVCAPQFGW